MGMSHGGWSALKAIKRSASADLQKKPFRAAVALYPYCGDSEQIVDKPTLLLIGEKDEWTPANLCVQYVNTLQSPHETTLKVFPGAHHVFDLEGIDSQGKGVIDGQLKDRIYRYDPRAAEKAIQMIHEFLRKWL
jgi:dienelactone hydrolase